MGMKHIGLGFYYADKKWFEVSQYRYEHIVWKIWRIRDFTR